MMLLEQAEETAESKDRHRVLALCPMHLLKSGVHVTRQTRGLAPDASPLPRTVVVAARLTASPRALPTIGSGQPVALGQRLTGCSVSAVELTDHLRMESNHGHGPQPLLSPLTLYAA